MLTFYIRSKEEACEGRKESPSYQLYMFTIKIDYPYRK
jgi:hypothetical protein